MNDERQQQQQSVLVTGFTPFGSHIINPSWEAVKQLHGLSVECAPDIRIAAHLLPVEYDAVDSLIPELWNNIQPIACIHVGVGLEGLIKLERCARPGPYVRLDNQHKSPRTRFIGSHHETDQLISTVEMESVRDAVLSLELECEISDDAGLFLCEYSLFRSLELARAPTVFCHVPPLGKPYTLDQLVNCIKVVIETAVAKVVKP